MPPLDYRSRFRETLLLRRALLLALSGGTMTEAKRRAVAHSLADAANLPAPDREPSLAARGVSVGTNYGTINVFHGNASGASSGGRDTE
jgi:hypothetical protein